MTSGKECKSEEVMYWFGIEEENMKKGFDQLSNLAVELKKTIVPPATLPASPPLPSDLVGPPSTHMNQTSQLLPPILPRPTVSRPRRRERNRSCRLPDRPCSSSCSSSSGTGMDQMTGRGWIERDAEMSSFSIEEGGFVRVDVSGGEGEEGLQEGERAQEVAAKGERVFFWLGVCWEKERWYMVWELIELTKLQRA